VSDRLTYNVVGLRQARGYELSSLNLQYAVNSDCHSKFTFWPYFEFDEPRFAQPTGDLPCAVLHVVRCYSSVLLKVSGMAEPLQYLQILWTQPPPPTQNYLTPR